MFSLWSTKLTGSDGTYNIDITNIRQDPDNTHSILGGFNNDFNSPFSYSKTGTDSKIYVQAECGDSNTGSETKTTTDAAYTGSGYDNFDVPVAAPLNVSIADAAVGEGDGNAILTITLNKTNSTDVTVQLDTADVSATAGDDYTAVTASTVTIPANETSTTTTVPITDDTLDELVETFTATISSPSTGLLLKTGGDIATVTITDNDGPPDVSMASATASVTEGNGSSTTTADVTVTLSTVSGLDVTVDCTTADGTAASASDYDQADGLTLTIAAGDPSGTIQITVNGDDTFEDNETFTVTLSNALSDSVGASIVTITTTVGTINNDDAPDTAVDIDTDIGSTDEDNAFTSTASVLANDPSDSVSGVTLTAVLVDDVSPGRGTLTLNSDGFFTFNPDGDFESLAPAQSTTTTFTYKARFIGPAGTFDSDPTTTTITVTGLNDGPETIDLFYSVQPDTNNVVTVANGLVNRGVTDVDSTTLTVSLVGSVSTGTLILLGDGSFTYDPGTFKGNATFVCEASDTLLTSNTSTVTLGQGPTLVLKVVTSTGAVTVGSVDEDATGAQFKVEITLVNGTTTPSTADFSTINDTAVSGTDFGTPSASSVSLNVNDTTTIITIPVINDAAATKVREGTEMFYVVLDNPGPGGLTIIAGGPGTTTMESVSIVDPSDAPTLSVEDLTGLKAVAEPNSVVTADVVVVLTGRTLLGAEVWFSTADGTSTTTDNAVDTNSVSPFVPDYVATSTNVVFGANATAPSITKTVSVTIRNDDIDEFIEVFNANLSVATEPAGSPGQITSLTITDAQADVIIVDADLAPVLVVSNPDAVVEGGTANVTVTLIGASSRGVTVIIETVGGGTATAGADYDFNSTTLSWSPDETGDNQVLFDIVTNPDTVEEDAESVIIKLRNASSTGADGVILLDTTTGKSAKKDSTLVQADADATAVLQINDDEPAMKVVTIVSEGEGMPGDPYFLVFTGLPNPDPGVTALAAVPELMQKAYGLDEVRSKPATHVWMGMITTTDPLGPMTFDSYTVGGTPVSATLDVVGQRTNRSFYLFPGTNYTGLALVPDSSNDTFVELLAESVPNANQELIDAIKAANLDNTELDRDVVKLEDVVETVWTFVAGSTVPTWNTYMTLEPVTGGGAEGGSLIDLEPFQGMLIETRTVAIGDTTTVPVFDQATASVVLHPVPVRMNIVGPFAKDDLPPPSKTFSIGFNLMAPHIWAETPFDTVFGGSGGDISETFSTALSRWRALEPWSETYVEIIEMWVTESASIPPFVGPGVLSPELAYWVRVAEGTPTLTATGPSTFDWP